MADERDDPVPTEDPRETGVSDQNAEEGPYPAAGPGSGRARRHRALARRSGHFAR